MVFAASTGSTMSQESAPASAPASAALSRGRLDS